MSTEPLSRKHLTDQMLGKLSSVPFGDSAGIFHARPKILIVDGQQLNRRMLRATIRSEPYDVFEASRASEAFEILEREEIDLVILDLMVPEMSGPDFCRRLKESENNRFVQILVLSTLEGAENEIATINSGADEFLARPLHPSVTRTRIRAMLRTKAATDRLEEAETILFALAQTIEQRDSYTSGHCQRLAFYGVSLGLALGLGQDELLALFRGGYLHDIGKVSTPDSILFKAGPLSEDEWTVMKSHTVRGEEICKPLKSLSPVLPIIRSHHERWDGTGYPDGLGGEEIPLLARILQIADIYDALTTERPYKKALSPRAALETMSKEVELGWRDPVLVAVFEETCKNALVNRHDDSFLRIPDFETMLQSLENMRRELLK